MIRLRSVLHGEWKLIARAGHRWIDTESYRLAAALSYYALLSLVPLLLLALGLVEFVVGDSDELRMQLLRWTSASGSETIDSAIRAALSSLRGGSTWTIAVGAAGALIGASGVFAELDTAMNRVFRSESSTPTFKKALHGLFWDRLTAFAFVGLTSMLVLAMAILGIAWDIAAQQHLPTLVGRLVTGVASFALLGATMASSIHLIPARHVPWDAALRGALWGTTLLFLLRPLYGWFIVKTTDYAAYGALGAILSTLLWLLVVAMVFLFAASVSAAAAERTASARQRLRNEPDSKRAVI